MAELCHERTLDEGAPCFIQGRKATELHLCRSGKVDIMVQLREPWGMEVTVHTAKEGEIIGWSTLMDPYMYTASARCVARTEDIYIKGPDLINLFKQSPHTGYIVMRNLSATVSSRLTVATKRLSIEIAATIHQEW